MVNVHQPKSGFVKLLKCSGRSTIPALIIVRHKLASAKFKGINIFEIVWTTFQTYSYLFFPHPVTRVSDKRTVGWAGTSCFKTKRMYVCLSAIFMYLMLMFPRCARSLDMIIALGSLKSLQPTLGRPYIRPVVQKNVPHVAFPVQKTIFRRNILWMV